MDGSNRTVENDDADYYIYSFCTFSSSTHNTREEGSSNTHTRDQIEKKALSDMTVELGVDHHSYFTLKVS